jgi:hypothetical protein
MPAVSRCQRRHHGPLVASRGFEDHHGGQPGLPSCPQGGDPGGIVGPGPLCTRGAPGHSQWGVRAIDPDHTRRGRPPHA